MIDKKQLLEKWRDVLRHAPNSPMVEGVYDPMYRSFIPRVYKSLVEETVKALEEAT